MIDEGIIKFYCEWIESAPVSELELKNISMWRTRLFDLGLIGQDEEGISFGNVSVRSISGKFIITGSQTGRIRDLKPEGYSRVTEYSFFRNFVKCEGPLKASSESLTHAMIYELDAKSQAVVHAHSSSLWKKLFNHMPTSSQDIPYGTPQMAKEVWRLFRESDLGTKKFFVMGGHPGGLIAFGKDVDEACKILLDCKEST